MYYIKKRFKLEVMRKYVGSLGLQELYNQVSAL